MTVFYIRLCNDEQARTLTTDASKRVPKPSLLQPSEPGPFKRQRVILYFRSPSVLSPAPRPPASPQSLILSTLIGYGYIAVFTAILNITTTNRKIAVLESIVMMCITRRKFVFFSVICSVVAGVPKLDEVDKKDRILEKDLSDKKHYEHEEHNVEYDHEAFLGEDAKKFDQLTPEESKRRLALIVDKIDSDSDGSVSQEELKDWIRYTQRRYIQDDVDRQWRTHNPEDKEKISWPEYKKMLYGFMDDLSEADVKEEEGFSYAAMQKRDRRRWAVADQDGDDILDKTEFAAFLHPEETGHMRDVVVLETMEDIDKDKDGKISQQEYIGDMYRSTDGEAEPEWVQNEKEQFSQYRDKDGDGFMDADEVKNWIIPPDFDHAEAEARHLIYESDSDGDSKLTKEEILNKYDIFVGSQATDFGEALARHDEF